MTPEAEYYALDEKCRQAARFCEYWNKCLEVFNVVEDFYTEGITQGELLVHLDDYQLRDEIFYILKLLHHVTEQQRDVWQKIDDDTFEAIKANEYYKKEIEQ